MTAEYRPARFEKKWQAKWKRSKQYSPTVDAVRGKKNTMILTEFPYPSGNLHIGHWDAFALPDILVRYERMRGANVLYPIGFDAFGLPAENAAIKRKLNPRVWTERNIRYMTKQLESMGATFDWSRQVSTIDPAYYRWTQWMFIKMFEKGLAYRAKTAVNWCPKDKTVLANEQVIDGKCERCDTEVVQKDIEQWMFKTTAYAERLLEGLDDVDWPQSTKIAQKNWIGKSEGARIRFTLKVPGQGEKHAVEVFTTRPDTIYGATFLVISPELADEWIKIGWQAGKEVEKYIQLSLKRRELDRLQDSKEKTGVAAGILAINPATGKDIPVWIADYVLGSYGTGAIMAVPAHDARDNEFAKRFRLPIKQVVEPLYIQDFEPGAFKEGESYVEREGVILIIKHWAEEKYLGLKWKHVDWGTFLTGSIDGGRGPKEVALAEIFEETGFKNATIVRELGVVGGKFFHVPKQKNNLVHAHMFYIELENGERDEVSEEEHAKHDLVWLTEKELQSFLTPPTHHHALKLWQSGSDVYEGSGILRDSGPYTGRNSEEVKKVITESVSGTWEATYKLRDWVLSRQRYWGVPIPMIHCATCGYKPVPEKQLPVLLPNLKEYMPTDDGRSPLAKAKSWVKVKCPMCKKDALRETDTMDTFVDSSWYYLRYTDPKNKKVFADNKNIRKWLPVSLYIGGAEHNTMHLLYSRFFAKVLHDLGYIDFDEPFLKRVNHGTILGPNGLKMSKSKGNVIDPDIEVKRFGSDTVRMYLGFMAPYDQGGPWDSRGIMGVHRFLGRTYALGVKLSKEKSLRGKRGLAQSTISASTEILLHQTIQKVGDDIGHMKFNTAIASLMILLNALEKEALVDRHTFKTFLLLLAPFAPHLTEELHELLKGKGSIHSESWPEYDPNKQRSESVKIVVQVNGKVRATITVPRDAHDSEIEKTAISDHLVSKWIQQGPVMRVIHVKNKLVNFVCRTEP